jgi:hypothetical protein
MKRKFSQIICAASILCLAACSDKSADSDKDGEVSADESAIASGLKQITPMKPGLWQIDVNFVTAEVTGLGAKKKQELLAKMSKAASSRRCLSPADAARVPASFYGGSDAGKCRYRTVSVTAGKAAIGLSCARENMATLDTELSGISGTERFDFDAISALRLPIIGKVELRGTATGRYTGACDAK